MTRRERAENNFKAGYSCAQSLVLAFADLLPESPETLAKLSSGFGGGMGRLRETCGAVSGMFFVISMLEGYSTPETGAVKAEHYKRIQDLGLAFEEKNGSLVCRNLLNLPVLHDDPSPSPRTKAYYDARPCARFIGDAAEILEDYLRSH